MHPETDNSQGSVHSPTSLQKYVRASCGGSPAVKYGGVSSPPCCAPRSIHATLFYLCLNIPKHRAVPCHSAGLRYTLSPTTLLEHSLAGEDIAGASVTLTRLPSTKDTGGEGRENKETLSCHFDALCYSPDKKEPNGVT